MAAHGYASEDTRRSWERARVLCEAAGKPLAARAGARRSRAAGRAERAAGAGAGDEWGDGCSPGSVPQALIPNRQPCESPGPPESPGPLWIKTQPACSGFPCLRRGGEFRSRGFSESGRRRAIAPTPIARRSTIQDAGLRSTFTPRSYTARTIGVSALWRLPSIPPRPSNFCAIARHLP